MSSSHIMEELAWALPSLDRRVDWNAHCTNGETRVTRSCDNDSAGHYAKIADSVEAFGDKSIWMTEDKLELHSSRTDLSDFWQFHRLRHGQETMP